MSTKQYDNTTADALCSTIRCILAEFLCSELTSDKVREITRVFREVLTGNKFEALRDNQENQNDLSKRCG